MKYALLSVLSSEMLLAITYPIGNVDVSKNMYRELSEYINAGEGSLNSFVMYVIPMLDSTATIVTIMG